MGKSPHETTVKHLKLLMPLVSAFIFSASVSYLLVVTSLGMVPQPLQLFCLVGHTNDFCKSNHLEG